MEEVKSLGYKEKPKYEALACILKTGLKAIRAKDDGKLEFTPPTGAVSPAKVRGHMHAFHEEITSLSFGTVVCTYIADEHKTSKVFS